MRFTVKHLKCWLQLSFFFKVKGVGKRHSEVLRNIFWQENQQKLAKMYPYMILWNYIVSVWSFSPIDKVVFTSHDLNFTFLWLYYVTPPFSTNHLSWWTSAHRVFTSCGYWKLYVQPTNKFETTNQTLSLGSIKGWLVSRVLR